MCKPPPSKVSPNITNIYPIQQKGSKTQFSYDANGNLISLTTPNNTTFETTHDAINYPETEISPLGSSTTYTYDRDRRLTTLTKPSGKSISYTYKGKRIESISTDTLTSTYSYGCGSQLESISTDKSISTDNGEAMHYSYDIYNRMTKQSYTGDTQGFKTTYSYNGYGERDEVLTRYNSTELFRQEILKRDEGGRILTKFEQLKGDSLPTITNYTYDRNGRLTQVQVDSTITERYTYDDNSNRLYEEINTTIGTYNQEDQLESYGTTEYTYDKDGYLQTKTTPTGTTTYEYSIFGA